MANQPNPNDPYVAPFLTTTTSVARRARSTTNCSPTPNSPRAPASGGRIAHARVAIAVMLGAVFYGLNNSTVHQAGTSPTAQTAQTAAGNPPAAPPGMRDVTPRANSSPGMTTGAAPRVRRRRRAAPDVHKTADPTTPASK